MKVAHAAVLWEDLRTSRMSTMIWGIALVLTCLLYLSVYPSMASLDIEAMVQGFPPALMNALGMTDLGSGAGYTQSAVFGLLGFVIVCAAGIGWGGALIGGANQDGRLELVLAHGVSRTGYVLQVAASIIIRLAALGALTFVTILLMNGPFDLGLNLGNLVAVVTAWLGLAAITSMLALALGAALGSKSIAIGGAGGFLAAAYLFQALASTNPNLDWLGRLSPYTWALGNNPLTNGFDWAGLSLLWGGAALLVGLAVLILGRRDISV